MSEISSIGHLPELPEKPDGWKREMVMHLNFGSAGGSAIYKVFNDKGDLMPIGYQYDTSEGGLTGFTLPHIEHEVYTWEELRKKWKEWIKSNGKELATPQS